MAVYGHMPQDLSFTAHGSETSLGIDTVRPPSPTVNIFLRTLYNETFARGVSKSHRHIYFGAVFLI